MHKKVAACLTALLFIAPGIALAQSSDAQAQIAALLAEVQQLTALINQLEAGQGASTTCVDLSGNLTLGSSGTDVTNLQNYLIGKGYLEAQYNTAYYGFLTAQAVGKLQVALGILSSSNDSAYGITGPQTRAAIACQPTTPSEPAPSGNPTLTVTSVSGLTVTLAYDNMPPAALEVFNFPVTSKTGIWKQELNGTGATSGQMAFTLPNGTPAGQYYVVAEDSAGNAIETKDASGNAQPASAQFTITSNTVQNPSSFTATPTSGSAPLTVAFSGGSSGSISFGDGTGQAISDSGVITNTTHIYNTPGVYTATEGESSVTITVNGSNTSQLSVTCHGSPYNAGTPGISWSSTPSDGTGSYAYQWALANDNTGTGINGDASDLRSQNLLATYASAGVKSATVTVTSGGQSATGSCSATIGGTSSVTINPSSLTQVPGAFALSGSLSGQVATDGIIVFLAPSSAASYGSNYPEVAGQLGKDGFYENNGGGVESAGQWSASFPYVNPGTYTVLVYDAFSKALFGQGTLTVSGGVTTQITWENNTGGYHLLNGVTPAATPGSQFTLGGISSSGAVNVVIVGSAYSGSTDWNTIQQLLVSDQTTYPISWSGAVVQNGQWSVTFNYIPEGNYNIYVYSSGNLLTSGLFYSTYKG